MTISILAFDEKTGAYGGAACTGSLCVGGWVLRGDAESGMSASQGTAPSTLWGTQALDRMKAGEPAADAVAELTGADPGAAHRQLSALDPVGGTGVFTGAESIPVANAVQERHVVVCGNMLSNEAVVGAALEGFRRTDGSLAERLLAALDAADVAGGDSRGLLSAALLVVSRSAAPLSLRIDHSDAPLTALRDLHARSQASPYVNWLDVVPTVDAPFRAPGQGD